MLENVGRQVRAAILGAAIRPLLQVWEPSVGQVRLPLGGKHKEPSEAFGNKRSNFQSCQENSEPPTDKVMTARKRTLQPARNRFLRDLIRGADPRLTASPSRLAIFAKLRKNGVPKKLDQMENRFHLVLSKHYISQQDSSAPPFRRWIIGGFGPVANSSNGLRRWRTQLLPVCFAEPQRADFSCCLIWCATRSSGVQTG